MMGRKLSIVKAGRDYDHKTLKTIGQDILITFKNIFTELEIEDDVENFEPSLNKDGYLPLYILRPLARYIETDPNKNRDMILCITGYPISGDGFGAPDTKTAFVSTATDHVSPGLPYETFTRRCANLSKHELGHVLGLEHHDDTYSQNGRCIMYAPRDVEKTIFLDENIAFCDICCDKLKL